MVWIDVHCISNCGFFLIYLVNMSNRIANQHTKKTFGWLAEEKNSWFASVCSIGEIHGSHAVWYNDNEIWIPTKANPEIYQDLQRGEQLAGKMVQNLKMDFLESIELWHCTLQLMKFCQQSNYSKKNIWISKIFFMFVVNFHQRVRW